MMISFRLKFFPKCVEVKMVDQYSDSLITNMSYEEFKTWSQNVQVETWFDESLDLLVGRIRVECEVE